MYNCNFTCLRLCRTTCIYHSYFIPSTVKLRKNLDYSIKKGSLTLKLNKQTIIMILMYNFIHHGSSDFSYNLNCICPTFIIIFDLPSFFHSLKLNCLNIFNIFIYLLILRIIVVYFKCVRS